ncbi:hypothetical protein BC629DRAFT_1435059 [Irpex lacteus]|nr:hypothetical protein BC629DRAFT_1435059 [Irpex lacteus]
MLESSLRVHGHGLNLTCTPGSLFGGKAVIWTWIRYRKDSYVLRPMNGDPRLGLRMFKRGEELRVGRLKASWNIVAGLKEYNSAKPLRVKHGHDRRFYGGGAVPYATASRDMSASSYREKNVPDMPHAQPGVFIAWQRQNICQGINELPRGRIVLVERGRWYTARRATQACSPRVCGRRARERVTTRPDGVPHALRVLMEIKRCFPIGAICEQSQGRNPQRAKNFIKAVSAPHLLGVPRVQLEHATHSNSQPAPSLVAVPPLHLPPRRDNDQSMEAHTRYSTYSLTADRIPEWLSDEPFNFDDAHTPPSYLIASLQEAFNEPSYDQQQPPTYDNIVGTSSDASPRRMSVAAESMWDDDDEENDSDDDETSEVAEDECDDEDEELAFGRVGSLEHPRYAGLWSSPVDRISEDSESLSTPTASSSNSNRSSAIPSAPPSKRDDHPHAHPEHSAIPPAYHLLHLQPLSSSGLREESTSYHDLTASLASLDDQLLLTPFSAFADACYEASVLGDTSPATARPFSPSPSPYPRKVIRALPPIPVQPSSSTTTTTTRVVEDDEEDSDEEEDDEVPKSPAQTFNVIASPPLIWDPKVEEHSRSRSELPISMSRSISAPYFLPPPHVHAQDVSGFSSPTSESGRSAQHKSSKADTMAEVAALFLRGPIHVGAQDSLGVSASPARAEREGSKRSRSQSRPRTNGSMKMKGLLRSLNISQPRWLPS